MGDSGSGDDLSLLTSDLRQLVESGAISMADARMMMPENPIATDEKQATDTSMEVSVTVSLTNDLTL